MGQAGSRSRYGAHAAAVTTRDDYMYTQGMGGDPRTWVRLASRWMACSLAATLSISCVLILPTCDGQRVHDGRCHGHQISCARIPEAMRDSEEGPTPHSE